MYFQFQWIIKFFPIKMVICWYPIFSDKHIMIIHLWLCIVVACSDASYINGSELRRLWWPETALGWQSCCADLRCWQWQPPLDQWVQEKDGTSNCTNRIGKASLLQSVTVNNKPFGLPCLPPRHHLLHVVHNLCNLRCSTHSTLHQQGPWLAQSIQQRMMARPRIWLQHRWGAGTWSYKLVWISVV